ncbi:MAG: hypothetical protein CMN21_10835 [Rubinisphaera sp.]|nr:hypothetical protein [Rubinisphaera sp.]
MLLGVLTMLSAAKAFSPNDIDDCEITQSETSAQIEALWREYSQQFSGVTRPVPAAIYARYSSRYQNSIIDQVRTCLEFASKNDIYVPLEHIYYDVAKTGRHGKRAGLQQMKDCLLSKQVETLLVFATNRLYRKSSECMNFVEKAVKHKKRRVVFVMNGIDSKTDSKWKRFLLFLSVFDEFASEMYVDHIRASHMGKFDRRQVTGTLAYGYRGKRISDIANQKGKFDQEIIIDEPEARWVSKIFEWFVVLKLSINTIIQRLNDSPDVPESRKGQGAWTRQAVTRLLKNRRYLGDWAYGVTESMLMSEEGYVRQCERDEPLRSQHFEELRIISEEQFQKAQVRLLELKQRYQKRKNRIGAIDRPAQILNGLFFCPDHDRSLIVGGSKSQYLICPRCQLKSREHRSLHSYLRRDLALELLCEKLAGLIQEDEQLVARIIAVCQRSVEHYRNLDDSDIENLKLRKKQLTRALNLLLHEEPTSESQALDLERIRREKREILTDVEKQLAAADDQNISILSIPSEDDIHKYLKQIEVTLLNVAKFGPPAEVDALRELLFQLTSGRIEVFQRGGRSKKEGWLEGRFTSSLENCASRELFGRYGNNPERTALAVEFRKPSDVDPRVELVWSMHQQGMLGKEIAGELNCCRGTVSKLLKTAADNAGEPLEDGRTRRASLTHKVCKAPIYQKIADEVVEDFKQGESLANIAEKFDCSSPTVKKAIDFWFQSRDLPVPTTADLREQMKQKAFEWDQSGMPLKTIAEKCDVSDVQIRAWLNEVYKERGVETPDRRKTRHLNNSGQSQ